MKSNILKKIETTLENYNKKYSKDLIELAEWGEQIIDAANKIARSWSGSFAGWHGRMYFKNFESPPHHNQFSGEWGGINGIPDGWHERTPEEIVEEIERQVGNSFSIVEFDKKIKNIKRGITELHNDIIISLSALELDEKHKKEKELVSRIEDFKLNKVRDEYISKNLPKQIMSRDSEAIRQGTHLPSHLYYEAVGFEALSLSKVADEFTKLVQRFVSQVHLKDVVSSEVKESSRSMLPQGLHADIQTKCQHLYDNGLYSEAVEKSFKIVRDKLRTLTSYETGSEAFGKGHLYIKGAAATNVEEDFNNGAKFLMMAIDQFRNEKSHTSDGNIKHSNRAYEYLALSSLAMRFLDNAEIRPE